jgi:pilus assembly protein CpaB
VNAQELSRTIRRHRALLAAGLTAAAVATALPTLAPPAPPTSLVVTAAHDLTPGAPLTADDLALRAVPRALVATGTLTDTGSAVGRVVSGRVRSGEALTDVRLLGAGLLQDNGLVATPVRLADAETVTLLHAGDRVDVLAAPTSGQPMTSALTVATALQVLAVPPTPDGTSEGGLVVLAATPVTAARLAAAAVGSRLSITVRGS